MVRSVFIRFLFFLHRHGILNRINFSIKSDPDKVKIPIIRGWGLSHLAEKEPWFDRVLHNLHRSLKNKLFVDCGVNIGQTLLKVKKLDQEIPYVGFEPNANCVFYTNRLIEENNISKVDIYPVGVSKDSSVLKLFFNQKDQIDANASMVKGFRKGDFREAKSVFINPEELKIWQDKIGCIKIDVEGGELEVIKGFKNLILRDRPIIICEILPVYSDKNVLRIERQKELLDMLDSMKYLYYRVNILDGSLENITSIEIHSDLEKCNYVFMPSEDLKG